MAMTPKGWSISALAVELARDRRTIAAAVSGLTPTSVEGRVSLYRLTEVIEKLQGPGTPTNFDDAKTRKMSADAELAEAELARVRKTQVPVEDVARAFGDEITACRAKMLSIPTKVGPRVAIETDENVCRDLIEREIIEALNELSGAGFVAGPLEAAA